LLSLFYYVPHHVQRHVFPRLHCRSTHYSDRLLGFGACRSLHPRKTSPNGTNHNGCDFSTLCETIRGHATVQRLSRCLLIWYSPQLPLHYRDKAAKSSISWTRGSKGQGTRLVDVLDPYQHNASHRRMNSISKPKFNKETHRSCLERHGLCNDCPRTRLLKGRRTTNTAHQRRTATGPTNTCFSQHMTPMRFLNNPSGPWLYTLQ
jgi:hypothetical protein